MTASTLHQQVTWSSSMYSQWANKHGLSLSAHCHLLLVVLTTQESAVPGQYTERLPDNKNIHSHATPLHSLYHTNDSTNKTIKSVS